MTNDRQMMRFYLAALAPAAFTVSAPAAFAEGWDPMSKASNIGGIANTRHNLSLSFLTPSFWTNSMDGARNQYNQVCVYCHTPHGANPTVDAPLWNRTNKGNSYVLYDMPLQSGQTPTQPGVSSLTCLSCHDGTVGIDSIVNMPGSGNYSAAQQTSQNNAFLDTWALADHAALNVGGCFDCHSNQPGGGYVIQGGVRISPLFDAFLLGADLTDDHPVGVTLPDAANHDFNPPTGADGNLEFYDKDSDSRADTNEVRFYDTGDGYEVECASCHDPHGVDGGGGALIPSFLRVSNDESGLCLTCHDK